MSERELEVGYDFLIMFMAYNRRQIAPCNVFFSRSFMNYEIFIEISSMRLQLENLSSTSSVIE